VRNPPHGAAAREPPRERDEPTRAHRARRATRKLREPLFGSTNRARNSSRSSVTRSPIRSTALDLSRPPGERVLCLTITPMRELHRARPDRTRSSRSWRRCCVTSCRSWVSRPGHGGMAAADSGRAYALIAPHEHLFIAGERDCSRRAARTVCVCTEQRSYWFDDAARVARAAAPCWTSTPRRPALRSQESTPSTCSSATPLWDRFTADGDVRSTSSSWAARRSAERISASAPRPRGIGAGCSWPTTRDQRASSGASCRAGKSSSWLDPGCSSSPSPRRALLRVGAGAGGRALRSRRGQRVVAGLRAADSGEHFLSANPGRPGRFRVAPARRESDGESRRAHDFIRERLPMRRSAEQLAAAAEGVAGGRVRRSARLADLPRSRAA